jgi:hypothetical protein
MPATHAGPMAGVATGAKSETPRFGHKKMAASGTSHSLPFSVTPSYWDQQYVSAEYLIVTMGCYDEPPWAWTSHSHY